MTPAPVAALFVRPRSIYHDLAADAWDESRDARGYLGPLPVVAHPPCRGWGRLRHIAKVGEGELALGEFAVAQVRRWGGVLEHPAHSGLWEACGLPLPGCRDFHGGWTMPVLQSWWDHRAPKATWLYIVGCEPADVPAFPLRLGIPAGRIEFMGRAERERTPPAFAKWLLDLAALCRCRQ